ncbi:hypothetical protein GSI_02703 [Ganoderma sinense ZZ0214-1]|uniref:Fe2OG dioxygenase domain-containing protein n=1 Tax=Ganoderma sinense ZZ0214-1 TaxID=1077348 RepID=A0A2G8SMC2_9APHY|nr:hypothetical protein GSI_02703 [Ganoderma sinense ZZ0214-1]
MSKRKQDKNEEPPPPRWPKHLKYMKSSIVAKPPYCQGTLTLPDSDFTLFYGPEGHAHRINLSTASAEQLQHLADTCAPATFGVAGEDVYDESYRKAGKLDNKDFSITFDGRSSRLAEAVRTELLLENPMRVKSQDLKMELYKLNVYGKDAFFKAHVDTPRSELMFGSLVIVFPTPHEGGALKLRAAGRHEGETLEWTFDSSSLLAQQEHPSIAYVAFFSDVEHEVMPVISGHRVTITYNLYYPTNESAPSTELNQISTNEQSFQEALKAALRDPSFLPTGGNLMFGLRHQYPLATSYKSGSKEEKEAAKAALRALEPRLKASDGVILKVLRANALDASLRILYEARWSQWDSHNSYVMADRVLPLPDAGSMVMKGAAEYLVAVGGELVEDAVSLAERLEKRTRTYYDEWDKATPVYWVTDHPYLQTGPEPFKRTIKTYGNEPTLDVVYWRVWILARVGPPGLRAIVVA